MASTEELEAQILAEMESNPDAYAEEESNVLLIDNDLRTISIPEGIKNLGVESDDDVHRLYFQMPKTYGEFDLSTFDIRINYKNGNIGDVYAVEDKNAEGDVITFSWLVGRNAVRTKGTTQFIVCLKKSDSSGIVQQEFNTTVASLNVLEGLETTEQAIQANADIIEQILKKIDGLTSISPEDIATAVEEYMVKNPPSGMTAEEKEQLQKNTEDISSLSEEIANLTGTGLSTEAIDKLEEVGNYLVYTTANGGSKWTELIAILRNGSSGDSGGTEVTISSISATYTGGDVEEGTALSDLTGITVIATYSDGSTATVTGYTLSGEIAEGENTITVSYGGKTTTFTVTGVSSGGTESNIAYLPVAYKGSEYWAYFPEVVAGDVYYIRYDISSYAVLRDFSPWATVSASETTWTYEKYNDNYYKITFVKDYGDIGLISSSSWADLEYSTIKYSKNAVPVE